MDGKAQLHESRRNLRCAITSHCHGGQLETTARDINIDSNIDSYVCSGTSDISEALNVTPTPGMIIRTFRSGLFGLTRRMVMAIPLSLQYGNLSQADHWGTW